VIMWGSTPPNNKVHGLVTLLSRRDWAGSPYGDGLRTVTARLLDHPDATIRMLAAPALPRLFADPVRLRDELLSRLVNEEDPGARAQLIAVLDSALAVHPAHIDSVLECLSGNPLWPELSPSPEPATTEPDTSTSDTGDYLIQILIAVAVLHQQPFATRLLQTWLSAPASHPHRAGRTCTWLRDYLHPRTGAPAGTADRAFTLLTLPIPQATALWRQAAEAGQPLSPDRQAQLLAVVKTGDCIAHTLYFASGAAPASQESAPATPQYAALAFPALEQLAQLSHPAVVHRVAETLEHLAEHDPARAFLATAAAATPPHGYQREPQGAETIMRIIDRYAADYRDILLTQPACLTALRQMLETFARSGWDQAIQRVQDLAEFLY
jgi:hypothetical protein